MADFYPVLKKAVAGLPAGSTPEQRAAIYEKARAALLRQLSARDPQPSESESMRQRLQLEEVIKRLERETEREQLEALERLADAPAPAPLPPRPPAPIRKAAPSRIPLYGGLAAALLLAAGGSYWFLWPAASPPQRQARLPPNLQLRPSLQRWPNLPTRQSRLSPPQSRGAAQAARSPQSPGTFANNRFDCPFSAAGNSAFSSFGPNGTGHRAGLAQRRDAANARATRCGSRSAGTETANCKRRSSRARRAARKRCAASCRCARFAL